MPAALAMLPWRPLTALCGRASPAPNISYWYRKHTSKTRLPILFIHGIGIGYYTYAEFIADLTSNTGQQIDDEQGIIAIELMSISMRICSPALRNDEMVNGIRIVLDAHGWDGLNLVCHSYGSAIAASILRDQSLSKRVKAAVMIDPICFLLHLPDVAYNFTRRKPNKASEAMLYYFSSQDMMISHTLARRFFWSEYILWKEDIVDLRMTVTLSGRDIIVPTKAVWDYLTDSRSNLDQCSSTVALEQQHEGDATEWSDEIRNVTWFRNFNHADLFATKAARRGVAELIRRYCEHPSVVSRPKSQG